MRIVETYSHMFGLDVLQNRYPELWAEVQQVIHAVDAEACRTKVSAERGRRAGQMLYSPRDMNAAFDREFNGRGWHERRVSYAVTADQGVLSNPGFFSLEYQEQVACIQQSGSEHFRSYNQTDFVKDAVAVEVQFGKYSFVAYDLFVKHLAFFQQRSIEVGIEVLPMRELQQQMSSGPAYYEGEIFNLARQGRNSPPVPLIVLGVAPDLDDDLDSGELDDEVADVADAFEPAHD